MILDPDYATDPKWTKFQTYILSDIPALIGNDIVMQALQYYGKASKETIETFLTARSGPLVKVLSSHPLDLEQNTYDIFYTWDTDVDDYENDGDVLVTSYGLKVHKLGVELLTSIVGATTNWSIGAMSGLAKNLYGIDGAHPWRQRQPDGSLTVYKDYV